MNCDMKNYFSVFFSIIIFIFLSACADDQPKEPAGGENMAYKWGLVSLEATENDTEKFFPRPTVTARILGLTWTAVYDAWSRFDEKAMPVYLTGVERMPEDARTVKNKETAISYAAYRAMLVYFPADSIMLSNKMKAFGFDPENETLDVTTPEGIGNLAAKAVVEARMFDGANQAGNVSGAGSNTPYVDYSGYKPKNSPDSITDVLCWQPKYFADGKGGKFAPGCLTGHWNLVKPLMLDSASAFRPPPPPSLGSDTLKREVAEVVKYHAELTNEQKALVEFMRDGPRSVQQAGHWLVFAQNVSMRDKHTLDEDVKMYFAVEAAAMDAFIACWDAKMYYDYARPYALVHYFYKDKMLTGWGGPGKKWMEIKGQDWRPYSPDEFLCPAFPSYVSGHSTVSGACAEILRLYTGNDTFGIEVKRIPGEFTEPGNFGEPVYLKFPTFTETANMAGISRVMGGYHIQADNVEGLKLGRIVGNTVYQKYLTYINGTASH